MHVTNKQFSDKFNFKWPKKIRKGRFIVILRILRQ